MAAMSCGYLHSLEKNAEVPRHFALKANRPTSYNLERSIGPRVVAWPQITKHRGALRPKPRDQEHREPSGGTIGAIKPFELDRDVEQRSAAMRRFRQHLSVGQHFRSENGSVEGIIVSVWPTERGSEVIVKHLKTGDAVQVFVPSKLTPG